MDCGAAHQRLLELGMLRAIIRVSNDPDGSIQTLFRKVRGEKTARQVL